jgi:hypothetical protein
MRLALPNVQICAISSVAIEETVEALERSCRAVAFGDALLLSHEKPSTLVNANIRWERVKRVTSREGYSHFVLRDLVQYVTRPHILLVQWDGFVISPKQWLNEFLSYDYIGAPWPQFEDGLDVGNGGFSLRSRRLVELTAREDWPLAHPEDIAICRAWRPQLEAEAGVRFAPREIAERFSQERGKSGVRSFGFHGLFRIPDVLTAPEVARLAGNWGRGSLLERMERILFYGLLKGARAA